MAAAVGMKWRIFFESGKAARVSALVAGLGVALGALGAHPLKPVLLQRPDGPEIWGTAVLYHLVHAVVMLVVAGQGARANRTAWALMLAGIVVFSGSLYGLGTTGWKALGPVTPLGGLFLLAGWAALAWRPARPLD